MSIVALEKSHPSIWQRPVLRAVDRRIFELRYFRRCMSCGFCADQCCTHGVDIDGDNVERLVALGDDFEAFVGVQRSAWFDGPRVADDEFPSRHHLRTRIDGSHCVFHDSGRRGCKIHSWALREGLDHRELKPMVSLLFPVTFEAGVLVPSTEVLDGSLVCSGKGDTLYDGARDELEYFFGYGLVSELDRLRASL